MHHARTDSRASLGMRAVSGAIGSPRLRAEEPTINCRRNDQPSQSEARPAISNRLGPRQIGENDAMHRIELLEREARKEKEGAAGLVCFRYRIRTKRFPKGFTLP